MNFEFATATRIAFGAGKRTEAFQAAAEYGERALVVTGANSARAAWLLAGLHQAGVETETFGIPGEPVIERVQEGAHFARTREFHSVISVGGGSAIDAGKAIAAIAANEADITYYLEIIGGARPLINAPLPFIAIPTTAGTGAEVTRNAVLLSREHQLKVSLRSPKMLPRLAIVDPELTLDLPPHLTAATGMDALTQLIEPFLCVKPNPITDALCREGIPRAARALPRAFSDPGDRQAREEMALASLLGGLALANAGLGAVHGFSAPIGGMRPAPHGAVCAALLPHVLRMNHRALAARSSQSHVLDRFDELGALLTGHKWGGAMRAIRWIENLCAALNIPSLHAWNVRAEDIPVLCTRAAQASSMKANPVQLTPEELTEILEAAL